jgi:hypothetical protein
MGVDTQNHVITHIHADFADKKDNQCLKYLTEKMRRRLKTLGLDWKYLATDAGYGSGENYAYLETIGIKSYIPPHGTYKGGPEGFTYKEEKDVYICPKGKTIPFKKHFSDHRTETLKKEYRASKQVCRECPLKKKCLGKSQEKRITVTAYRSEYERNNARVYSKKGSFMKKKRQSTIEPVFGSLINYYGMRKVNTKGIKQADKIMLMAASAYNLKKLLKFRELKLNRAVKSLVDVYAFVPGLIMMILSRFKQFFILRRNIYYYNFA